MADFREEKDSLGTLQVPAHALYQAQTQRAVENFPISGLALPRRFIAAVALIKEAAAQVNLRLGLLEKDLSEAIQHAARTVREDDYDEHFPVDVFQTGSGTSTNMNVNEVLATLASRSLNKTVNPNDHVNMGQSSNDVIPTALHLSTVLAVGEKLLPALVHLQSVMENRAAQLASVTKTGRTHLMDAMPVTFGQEISGWAGQVRSNVARIEDTLARLRRLPQGGTAVGTGINAHPDFATGIADELSRMTGVEFHTSDNFFESLSAQDSSVELSGQLRVTAVSLMKIANDLRWMNSGPLAGLGEIELPVLQPGSSIMPGKVNPVIPEAVTMVAAQVIGNDTTITVAGQAGNFQLNVMLPVIAYNQLQSIELLANAATVLADKAVAGFEVRKDNIDRALSRNPVLVTALNPVIGYDKAAEIAKKAYREQRPVIDVAAEMTDKSREELEELLDPEKLTTNGP